MKKLAVLLFALSIITASAYAAEDKNIPPQRKNPPTKEEMIKIKKAREAEFEQKLGLTEEQKTQARELRKKGFEKIKPVMDQIHQKHKEIKSVKEADISAEIKEQKLAEIEKELKELHKQAGVIRKENMTEFESILTKDQQKTLKNMKKEGRKNFEQKRRLNPPPCPPKYRFEK